MRASDGSSPDAQQALASLCRDYWRPLYHFARRRGQPPEDAQDLTQGFILSLLEANAFAAADQNRGKFRSFLLGAFGNYLAKEHRARATMKRGGDVNFVNLEDPEAEALFASHAHDRITPELEFDRNWALATLESVMVRLRAEYESAGRLPLFTAIQPHLSGGSGRPGYAQIGATLGLSESAVTVAMHRMRKRYGELLRETIASTVADSSAVEEELRHLISILSHDGAA
jgi:RNA polymerase sigma-70 factor (ECF subfamily)